MPSHLLVAISFCVALLPGTLIAQTVNPEIRDAIMEFADDICGVYELRGEGSASVLEGKAEASVNGLIGKLATLGVDGKASIEREKYTNVERDDIAGELKDVRTCRIEIWKDLKDTLIVIDRERTSTQTDNSGALPVAKFDPNAGGTTQNQFRPYVIKASPSFDCRKASTTSERILCTDANAAAYDVAMAETYKSLRAKMNSSQKQQLRDTQRRWLSFRDQQCLGERDFSSLSDNDLNRAAACLVSLISERRDQLLASF